MLGCYTIERSIYDYWCVQLYKYNEIHIQYKTDDIGRFYTTLQNHIVQESKTVLSLGVLK